MKNKIREEIKKILFRNNEWNVWDDEIEDGFGSVEYHKEELEVVTDELLSLVQESEVGAVRDFVIWYNKGSWNDKDGEYDWGFILDEELDKYFKEKEAENERS